MPTRLLAKRGWAELTPTKMNKARTTRYRVLRVPDTGPNALIAALNDFATEAEANARIREVEAQQLQPHHTYLEVWPYRGDRYRAMTEPGIPY